MHENVLLIDPVNPKRQPPKAPIRAEMPVNMSPAPNGPIVIVGVTGQVGSRVATMLSEAGKEVRGVARHPHDYTGTGNVALVAADCREPDAARRALEGASAVYLTPPLGDKEPLEDQRLVTSNVINAARELGIAHVVMHTSLKAKEGDTGAQVIDAKNDVEATLKASGVPFTILRPGWFLDNLLAEKESIAAGTIVMPIPPERRFGVVAAGDIAKAAVGFLDAGPQNRGFDLHVAGGVDGPELAQAATKVLGQPVIYREAPLESFVKNASGTSTQEGLQRELYSYLREHDFLGNPNEIKDALQGFRYTDVEQFMQRKLGPVVAATSETGEPTPWMPKPPDSPPFRPDGSNGPSPPPPGPHMDT